MKTKLSWLETVLLTAPFVVLAIYWNDLPARVPIHWNFRGQIDGWATKTPGIFVIPLTALGITALLRVLPWFDPRLRRTLGDESLMPAVLPIIRLAVLFLLLVLTLHIMEGILPAWWYQKMTAFLYLMVVLVCKNSTCSKIQPLKGLIYY
jgi:hypothetical protein